MNELRSFIEKDLDHLFVTGESLDRGRYADNILFTASTGFRRCLAFLCSDRQRRLFMLVTGSHHSPRGAEHLFHQHPSPAGSLLPWLLAPLSLSYRGARDHEPLVHVAQPWLHPDPDHPLHGKGGHAAGESLGSAYRGNRPRSYRGFGFCFFLKPPDPRQTADVHHRNHHLHGGSCLWQDCLPRRHLGLGQGERLSSRRLQASTDSACTGRLFCP